MPLLGAFFVVLSSRDTLSGQVLRINDSEKPSHERDICIVSLPLSKSQGTLKKKGRKDVRAGENGE